MARKRNRGIDYTEKFKNMSPARQAATLRNWDLRNLAYHGRVVMTTLQRYGLRSHAKKVELVLLLARTEIKRRKHEH